MPPTPEKIESAPLPVRMLLSTDGAITGLLEATLGGRVVVEALSNELDSRFPGPRELELGLGCPVLRRRVVLRLGPNGRPLLRASSALALDRFDKPARVALLLGSVPIGRVLQRSELETRRELLHHRACAAAAADAAELRIGLDVPVFERTYRIIGARGPLAVITERIPESIFEPAPAARAA